ncbi:hypothetical protein AK830_g5185 [Neonectria ditissima]|uniref:Rhodopsin domain-containing protein n=1 Tax=Neonectria ditissima TaxID=78410 RepID=A0A0N8H7C6_9HYPO|nr:hypothetical protein AK830_g5185 [Neonectria ditissima]
MQSRQVDLLSAEFITFPVALVFLGLRLTSRRITRAGLWWDDYFAIACFATAIVWAVMLPLWVRKGFGLHARDVKGMTFEEANSTTKKFLFFIEHAYAFTLFFAKISILSFYWRMFRVTNIKIAIRVLTGCSVIWILARTFLTTFHCIPVQAFWDYTIKNKKCAIKSSNFFFGTVLTHVIIDIAILVLPIVQIQKLQLPKMQKVGIILMFMFGILVCVAGLVIVAVSTTFDNHSEDMTWTLAPIITWATVEVNLVTISTCLPTIRPACLYIFSCGHPSSTIGSGSNSYGQSYVQSYGRSQNKNAIRLSTLPKDEGSSTHELAGHEEGGRGSISSDFETHALDRHVGNIATATGPSGSAISDEYPESGAFGGGIMVKNETVASDIAGPEERHPSIFEGGHVWLDVPAQLTFVSIEDPYSQGDVDILPDNDDASTSTARNDTTLHQICHDDFDQTLDVPSDDPNETLLLDASDKSSPCNVEINRAPIDPGILALHLLRHFKEGPGQWMDLFDTGAYFSSKVPVIAVTRPLLKSAVCALAAKHLHHIDNVSHESYMPSTSLSCRNSIVALFGHHVDWHYESATYYDQAIGHLKAAVNLFSHEDLPDKEEIFAAVVILCTYELMDAPGTAWRAHLSALPLFSPEPDAVSIPSSPVIIPRAAIKGPIFWSLARQDLLCAFISETQTRLDLKDMRLWQNAGLAADQDGFLLPFSPPHSADVRTLADVEEDTKSNELTWLLGKIANYLTSGDALYPEDYALPPGQRPIIGVTQEQLLERWILLIAELHKWHASLPPTFAATARTKASARTGCQQSAIFDQVWYALPLCAATMQNYHMASILLHVNRPQESTAIRSTVSARLKSYRQIQAEVGRHAREICGISLANPTDPVRLNSVQSLFVAGQVFHQPREQSAVLELLAGIERDLGWTTSYHTAKLVDEWTAERNGDEEGQSGNWMLS